MLNRSEIKAIPSYERFLLDKKDFSKQYSHLYVQRSTEMRAGLVELVKREWGESFPLAAKIIDTEVNLEELKQEIALIGILYKEMSQRASVLDEFKEHGGISGGATESVENYVSQNDTLILEDESGRVAVGGDLALRAKYLVSGIMVALKGSIGADGNFHASEMLTSGLSGINVLKPSKCSSSSAASAVNSQSNYVMLISGLSIGGGNTNAAFSLQLLVDFLSGRLGGEDDVALASRVSRVIICGNSVVSPEILHGAAGSATKDAQSWSHGASKANQAKLAQENIAPIRELDTLLAQALMTCPIDIMPGNDDPGTFTMPQQPLHPCLLPQSSRYSSLSLVTNPYELKVNGLTFLGHSGDPVSDIARQTYFENPSCAQDMQGDNSERSIIDSVQHHLQILHNTYKWGHICPTAPDSLPCYPFIAKDPFVLSLEAMPHVLFCGNAPGFATEVGKTLDGHTYRVVCVPKFSDNGVAVLLDVDSLDVSTMEFGIHPVVN